MSRSVQAPRLLILSFVSGLFLFPPASYVFSLDGLEILRVSSREQAAVIKSDDTGVRLVRVGDLIGTSGRVVRIDSHGLVIREVQNGNAATVIIRLENGRQTIRAARDVVDRRPALYQPVQTGRKQQP